MPIIKSAIKRVKQAQVRRERNVATKRAMGWRWRYEYADLATVHRRGDGSVS